MAHNAAFEVRIWFRFAVCRSENSLLRFSLQEGYGRLHLDEIEELQTAAMSPLACRNLRGSNGGSGRCDGTG